MTIARAYMEHFRPAAEANKGGRPTKEVTEKPTADRQQVLERQPTTAKKAAEVVGMSERQYQRGNVIQDQAEPEVKDAWTQGKISTNAAYEKTREKPARPRNFPYRQSGSELSASRHRTSI